ncbi:arabinogalactan endo-1,4-beta-galactosidase [Paenibacillus nanensis]|uniref:Arabinogalactan endo-beta-1,4-galactanase n=1 Tax=Paenibacillus nanensis TaxID=393251 RepID=A0A3A1VIW2_9BACL|nr:glycosyl hydrolase 53 family protein [Paenibacillus nanensis]RIX60401.1 arabinogalactan endo-1,4-beta-galactosidase [Paenibacillus nanensis]
MKRWKSLMAGVLAAVLLLPSSFGAGVHAQGEEGTAQQTSISLQPIAALESRDDFIRGVDVSMLKQIESAGGSYYNADGVQADLFDILKANGVNWIRLRTWVDPTDEHGAPLGGGNNDTETTVELASRAKAKGLKVLLDFHYSDFWTDPGEQETPKAWEHLSGEALANALHAYTSDVITRMKAAGAAPDMVQIGNETNGGMVWPSGKTWQETPSEVIGGYDGWVQLIRAGTQAVRENAPAAKIVLHLANGGNNKLYRDVFDELTERGVDFDIIGLSYYSYWHGTLEQLKANMNDISARYNKDVMVVETAYAHTFENGDSHGNIFGPNEENVGGYKATLQGQATSVRDVMEAVAEVPNNRGLGIFYWEPAWIPVEGAGWKTGEGNAWDNQAMFDFAGKELPSLQVFNIDSPIYSGAGEPAAVTAVRPEAVHVSVGQTPVLPATVKVEYSNDRIETKSVTWSDIPAARLQYPGAFTVEGTVSGIAQKATVTITVQGATNYVTNPSFESGSFAGWEISDEAGALGVEHSAAPAGNAYNGTYSLHYWMDSAFTFSAKQTISNLPAGTYTLSARSHGGGGENALQLYAVCGGEKRTADIVHTGWHEWKHPMIQNIEISQGDACEIGVTANANNGNWGNIDEISLYRDASEVTLAAPGQVAKGDSFTVEAGVAGLASMAYAQDLTVTYDGARFEFVSAASGTYYAAHLQASDDAVGTVRIIGAYPQGLGAPGSTVRLTFKAKPNAATGAGDIAVASAELGMMPEGNVLRPAKLHGVSVSVTEQPPVYAPVTGGQTNETPTVQTGSDGASSVKLTPKANEHGRAEAEVDQALLTKLLDAAESGPNGKRLTIQVAELAGADGYGVKLPAGAFDSGKGVSSIQLITPLGELILPARMLEGADLAAQDGSLLVSMAQADTSNKNEVAAASNDTIQTVVDISLSIDGDVMAWSNPDAPVTVRLPYEIDAANKNEIVIRYIDGEGSVWDVPNGRYDRESGTVTFRTTHFSYYAIAESKRSFSDLSGLQWAEDAIQALAARGVLQGRDGSKFDPDAPVTRAEFATMLARSLGLFATGHHTFADSEADAYYAESLNALQKLNIAQGDGTGSFQPEAYVTRQDAVLLAVRSLEAEGWQPDETAQALDHYTDGAHVAPYARTATIHAVNAGILRGYEQKLLPERLLSRAEAAVMIDRILESLDE